MFRHVFLIPIKAGTSEELLQKKMQEMRDKAAFDRLIASEAHQRVAGTAEEAFVPGGAVREHADYMMRLHELAGWLKS